MGRILASAVVFVACLLAAASARADLPWSDGLGSIADDIRHGKPLVVNVEVPLCSNEQIDCGSAAAGRPDDLATNLYWGAVFGARRFFDRPHSGYERVEVTPGKAPALQRVVYRRYAAGTAWGLSNGERVEEIVVLEAVRGASINRAVERFWSTATSGGRVIFRDGDRDRDERIHVVGYAGHDRLMDGLELPAAKEEDRAKGIPSFVLACYSDRYFGASLRQAGSVPLVTTDALMAPEGYVIEAVVRALGDGVSRQALREGVVDAYATWQHLSKSAASRIFTRVH